MATPYFTTSFTNPGSARSKENAAAAMLVHNHPSGNPSPSNADRVITSRLMNALALIDIRILDHLIVAGTNTSSFAEQGVI